MGADRVITVGVAAHISAASPGGPRFDPSLAPEERRSHSNGIWLCSIHARLVDVDESNYPVELLQGWKRAAENRELGIPAAAEASDPPPGWIDARLLDRLPAAVGLRLTEAVQSAPDLVQNLSQWVGNPEDRPQNVRLLVRDPPRWLLAHAPLGWLILAELADAHGLQESGGLYRNAAAETSDPAERRALEVQSYLCDSKHDLSAARVGLEDLLSRSQDPRASALTTVVLAALDQDLDTITSQADAAMGVSSRSDTTVQHFVGQVHRARGDLDGAISIFESLASAGRGGINLLLAGTLLARGTAETAFTRAEDCLRARSIALDVRDERRRWGGDSIEAARTAVQASAGLDDWAAVIQIGSAADGEATPAEAADPEVVELVGVGAIFEGSSGPLSEATLSGASPSGRAWLRGMQYRHDPSHRDQAVAEFEEATTAAANPLELERALRGLAIWGVHPLPRLEDLARDEPDHAAALGAFARYRLDEAEENLGELRRLSSGVRMAAGFLSLIENERGNHQLSAQIALDAADRFGDSTIVVQAVAALFDPDPVLAAQVARDRVEMLPADAPARRDLRQALLDLAVRSGEPSEVLRAASEAVADAVGGDRAEWLVVDALRVMGRSAAAWDRIKQRNLRPETEREAQIFLAVQADAAPAAADEALAVLDLFSSSHDVLASGLGLFLGRNHDEVDEETGRRYGAHLQRFTSLFPESPAIRQVHLDPNDPAAAIAAIQETMPTYSEEAVDAIARVAEELQVGRLPVGACASLLNRSELVLLVSGRHASVPHVATGDRFLLELPLARDVLGEEAIVDLTALSTGSLAPELWDVVQPLMSRIAITSSQLAEAKDFSRRSPATGYFVPTVEGVRLTDVAESDREAIEERSRWIADVANSLAAETPPMVGPLTPIPEVELEGCWAHALHLAKASGRVLIADDPALLELARLAGVRAVSSVAILLAASEIGRVDDARRSRVLHSLLDAGVVDLPLSAETLCVGLEALGWPERQATAVLSRGGFWQMPNSVEAHHRICRGVARADRRSVSNLAAASVLGIRRAIAPPLVAGFAGAVMAQLLLATEVQADEVPAVLAGARGVWPSDESDPVDALVRALRDLLSDLIPSEDVARLTLGLVAELTAEDRETARSVVFGPS